MITYMKCFRSKGRGKVNGAYTSSVLCDPLAYVDMWVAWTDTYNFSMGLGLEVGSNIISEFDDDTDHNEINTMGFGTWTDQHLFITFLTGKFTTPHNAEIFVYDLMKKKL